MIKNLKLLSIKVRGLAQSNKGVTIKEIAATVGILVIVGMFFGLAKGQVGNWFNWFFDKLQTFIDTTFK